MINWYKSKHSKKYRQWFKQKIKAIIIKIKKIKDKNKNKIKKSVSFKIMEVINPEKNKKAISYIRSCFDNKIIYFGYGGFILYKNQR